MQLLEGRGSWGATVTAGTQGPPRSSSQRAVLASGEGPGCAPHICVPGSQGASPAPGPARPRLWHERPCTGTGGAHLPWTHCRLWTPRPHSCCPGPRPPRLAPRLQSTPHTAADGARDRGRPATAALRAPSPLATPHGTRQILFPTKSSSGVQATKRACLFCLSVGAGF